MEGFVLSLRSRSSRSSLTWRLAQAPPLELWRESIDLGQLRRPWAAREATRATGAEPFAILAAEGITLHREWLRFLGSVLLLLCCNQLKVARVGHLVGHYARRTGLGGMRIGPHDRIAGVGAKIVRGVGAAKAEAEVDEAERRVKRELPSELSVGLVRRRLEAVQRVIGGGEKPRADVFGKYNKWAVDVGQGTARRLAVWEERLRA